jgi:purine-binding chemotaxis protein CheW
MSQLTQYLTLGVDREVFGIPIENVREILDMREVSRLPHAPKYLVGIIDVRGRSVPVVDLRTKLGLPATETTPSTRIVVLEIRLDERMLAIGLIADRVFEVTSLPDEAMEAAPEIGVRWRSEYITGIGRRADGFVIVFDLARLFASDEAALANGSSVASAA